MNEYDCENCGEDQEEDGYLSECRSCEGEFCGWCLIDDLCPACRGDYE